MSEALAAFCRASHASGNEWAVRGGRLVLEGTGGSLSIDSQASLLSPDGIVKVANGNREAAGMSQYDVEALARGL
jgi:hypothetical protein